MADWYLTLPAAGFVHDLLEQTNVLTSELMSEYQSGLPRWVSPTPPEYSELDFAGGMASVLLERPAWRLADARVASIIHPPTDLSTTGTEPHTLGQEHLVALRLAVRACKGRRRNSARRNRHLCALEEVLLAIAAQHPDHLLARQLVTKKRTGVVRSAPRGTTALVGELVRDVYQDVDPYDNKRINEVHKDVLDRTAALVPFVQEWYCRTWFGRPLDVLEHVLSDEGVQAQRDQILKRIRDIHTRSSEQTPRNQGVGSPAPVASSAELHHPTASAPVRGTERPPAPGASGRSSVTARPEAGPSWIDQAQEQKQELRRASVRLQSFLVAVLGFIILLVIVGPWLAGVLSPFEVLVNCLIVGGSFVPVLWWTRIEVQGPLESRWGVIQLRTDAGVERWCLRSFVCPACKWQNDRHLFRGCEKCGAEVGTDTLVGQFSLIENERGTTLDLCAAHPQSGHGYATVPIGVDCTAVYLPGAISNHVSRQLSRQRVVGRARLLAVILMVLGLPLILMEDWRVNAFLALTLSTAVAVHTAASIGLLRGIRISNFGNSKTHPVPNPWFLDANKETGTHPARGVIATHRASNS